MYNWTEATFYGVSNMWILFLLSIMKVPKATDEVLSVESYDLKENIQL